MPCTQVMDLRVPSPFRVAPVATVRPAFDTSRTVRRTDPFGERVRKLTVISEVASVSGTVVNDPLPFAASDTQPWRRHVARPMENFFSGTTPL